jgi:uncharacterized protein YndB with AHSA1/START domain
MNQATAKKEISAADLTVTITEEIHVKAGLEDTFEALLAQVGEGNTTPDGTVMPMKLEARPGGRWYRDLGDDNGHFWGTVQAIKRPTLLEITGPLFMSYAAVSNLQYRLSKVDGGTLIKFHHIALGLVPEEHREGMGKGWKHIHEQVRQRAEGKQGASFKR